ncbi:MAG: hypothetical protein JJE22_14160 [Bacteroidia bacterium]|nr:hypothetical protein [Bacteroidia bacterium]
MKKALISITLFCYLAVSCGVIVNFHFCMDRLASSKLFASESKVCDKCGMHNKGSKGCCHDEIKMVKLQVDQQITQAIYSLQAPDPIIAVPSDFIVSSLYNCNGSRHLQDHSPPLLTEQDTYLRNCDFRI